jgi:hypothetical protein
LYQRRVRNCSTDLNADAGPQAARFLNLLAALVAHEVTPAMVVAVTIRADRYEPLQVAPELAGVHAVVFDELKPMPPAGYLGQAAPSGSSPIPGREVQVANAVPRGPCSG